MNSRSHYLIALGMAALLVAQLLRPHNTSSITNVITIIAFLVLAIVHLGLGIRKSSKKLDNNSGG